MNKETLYKFFGGSASFEEEVQIRKWMESSAENEQTFFKERKIYDAITLLANEKNIVNRRNNLKIIFREILKIASVVLITIGIGYFFSQHKEMHQSMAMQTVIVPSGQRINMKLPDGTNVWLNARSTLSYPVSFNEKERTIELDGEAYFEVVRNEKVPFIVKTSKADIEVLGTTFDVNAYSEQEEFETTLMKGSVKITSKGDKEETIFLTPDNKTILRDGRYVVEKVEDYTEYRWIEGLICFKNEPFTEIMKTFEKYYGVKIKVNNQKVQKYMYTGKFRHTDGVDYALRVLQKDIYFTYTRDDENHIIYIQ